MQPEPVKNTIPINAAPSPAISPAASPAVTASPAASPATSAKADDPAGAEKPSASLEGKWTGVEGTALNVTKDGDKFKVAITNMEGRTETFDGVAKGDSIEFKRKDKIETVKAASGDDTGMKWLAGKKNCVVITKGSEGYCKQ